MALERSAGAVVFFRDPDGGIRYLLLQYGPGHWDFPRGNMEKGETELDTAIREVREEANLRDLRIVPGFRDEATWYYRRGGKTIRKTASYLLAESPTTSVTISHEHKGYQWLPFEAARARATFDNARRILEKAQEFLTGERPPPQTDPGQQRLM